MKYYHVTNKWDEGNLKSLADMIGESEAIEVYASKWPEAGGLAIDHINVIHLHHEKEEAESFVADFGGEILEIDGEEIEVVIDTLEYPHPVCRHEIDACLIRRLS